ncbi:uncharacterized protein LOC102628781 isoform X3 [Citrus sinensis]|uniref:uncharacterized protein LOC102628781 isoform X3 n=1 Tax=Citrus sinensis TaxID=2711 RepID=UPI002279E0A3|nr:uncharacterized protein LOC102628781 isoform X3 [Citrus sinensis]
MATAKRELELPDGDKPESVVKKAKVDDPVSDSSASGPHSQKQRVVLNPADCDLDFDIEDNGLKGSGLHQEGFAYCWSGARANVGINGGKYCFGCKIVSTQPVDMEDTPPDQQHVCRVGTSRGDDPVGKLGETEKSFGFGGTGKFSHGGNFLNFREKFGVGDTIICAIDLESKPLATIGFAKNGKWLGTAKQFDAGSNGLGVVDSAVKERQCESAVFPHILLKNVVVVMQFSVEQGLIPVEGYKSWVSALDDGNSVLGPTFCNMKDCEVMMMVGLPASGKTTWAEKWVKDHPEKRYILLGTNLILEQMKVPGLLRKHNYSERFQCLMGRANAIFDVLLSRASRTPRNFIIDQTNVFKSARKRKLRLFVNFRKIAVVVFPKPEDLKIRSVKRFKEMGKEVPADAVNNMLANYVLPVNKDTPGSDELFDQVMFVELDREEAQRHLDEMKGTLGSVSNPNLQTNYAPYSHENFVKSLCTPPLNNQEPLSVGGGLSPQVNCTDNWQSTYLPPQQVNYGYQMPNRVNAAYQASGSYSQAYQGYQNSLIPRASAPSGTYLSNERGSVPVGNSRYRESYGPSTGGRINPYQGYGVVEPYSRPVPLTDPRRTGMVEPSPMGSARTSFTHNASAGQFRPARGPQNDLQAPRAPMLPPSPLPSTHGLPYQTPMARPSHENFPTYMQHPGRNATPYPSSTILVRKFCCY